jgi:translation initiation factor eIF-2B subunit delta
VDKIEQFIHERVTLADEQIAKYGVSKINDQDVILTYARFSFFSFFFLVFFTDLLSP